MQLTDLIIIYLACGAPFGVYQITKRQPEASVGNWAIMLASFLLWPVFAVTLIANWTAADEDNTDTLANARIENIRSEIERVAFAGGETAALFEFREVFYRFTGLFEAANTEITKKPSSTLFAISGHINKDLASQCLARRNREKLSFHQTLARNEFVDVIADLARDKKICWEIGRLALELTHHLGDDDAMADLSALLPGRLKTDAVQISDPETQGSKSIPHSVQV